MPPPRTLPHGASLSFFDARRTAAFCCARRVSFAADDRWQTSPALPRRWRTPGQLTGQPSSSLALGAAPMRRRCRMPIAGGIARRSVRLLHCPHPPKQRGEFSKISRHKCSRRQLQTHRATASLHSQSWLHSQQERGSFTQRQVSLVAENVEVPELSVGFVRRASKFIEKKDNTATEISRIVSAMSRGHEFARDQFMSSVHTWP